jgi:hypothetical protein
MMDEGNPGPCARGATIAQARDGLETLWMTPMSYARRSATNNYADYQFLCTGLEATVRYHWHPLQWPSAIEPWSFSFQRAGAQAPFVLAPSLLSKLGKHQRLGVTRWW